MVGVGGAVVIRLIGKKILGKCSQIYRTRQIFNYASLFWDLITKVPPHMYIFEHMEINKKKIPRYDFRLYSTESE